MMTFESMMGMNAEIQFDDNNDIMIMRIFIQEWTLQHVRLLSTCVLVKLNGKRKKKNCESLSYYEKFQKLTLILTELVTTAIKIHNMKI